MGIARRLQKGDVGADIDYLAEQLSHLGYATGQGDQGFNDALENAVKEFQQDYGLASDGQVGPITAEAVRRAIDEFVPGSLRVDDDVRRQIVQLHQELVSHIDKLDALCARSFGAHTNRNFTQFTLTRTPTGPKIEMKFDPGVEIPASSLASFPGVDEIDYIDTRSVDPNNPAAGLVSGIARGINTNLRAMCYIDPPGICQPCSIVIVIVIK